jgi:hypothetical protein
MPSSRNLISSQTLGSAQASVTFSSIPTGYTDLVLRMSIRNSTAGAYGATGRFKLNGDTATNYSVTTLEGNGSSASSNRISSQAYGQLTYNGYDAGGNTASTFSSIEFYIPSYLASQNKPISTFTATENNTTTGILEIDANLWRNTAAITSIEVYSDTGNFVADSSFYLYGIKNS